MIYYFSGLGNTKYVAGKIAEAVGEDKFFIPDIDPLKQYFRGKSLGFLFPIYSWGVPGIVIDFIHSLPETFIQEVKSNKLPVWMVCTCGDETGNAPEMLEKCLLERDLSLNGAWSVIMPNTYVLLPGFDVDSSVVEKRKLENSERAVQDIAEKIKNGIWEWKLHRGSMPYLRTKIVYPLFKKWGISAKKWHHSSACVKCGKCVKSCPVKNIALESNGPVWGDNCLSCLACYHNCPYHAVEYGGITKKKGQYVCPLK
ncbi:MAG: EFR1 family ferrodoxin [Muribaculaceae bacterium]|nr:EFR1 family ferrodoxin [Muribaculaceae bacterium]